ncbi:MAG: protein kinase [Chloroflexota bacterium]|nr:protein kinase [Chloroflexota bacterium]
MSTVPRRISKYSLQQQLGSGSLGEVWKGHELQTLDIVAIKIFHADLQSDPNFSARFNQEGQAVMALHHPNIAQVYECDITRAPDSNSTIAYMVSEYIEGETLTHYLQNTSRKGQFPSVSALVYLFKNIAAALDYAHQNGVIHGSLKPSNILLDNQNALHSKIGEPKLSDFGMARLVKNTSSSNTNTALYMAPEQAKGQNPTESSDIYSLGIILYEVCTGVQPFRSESPVAIMMQHINVLPTPPILINANIPPGLSEVILRALAKDPATRFRTAAAFASAVASACSVQPAGTVSLNDESALNARTFSGPLSGPLSRPLPSSQGVSGPLPGPMRTNKLPALSSISMPLPAVTRPMIAHEPPPAPPALRTTPVTTTAVLPVATSRKEMPTIYAVLTVLLILFILASTAIIIFLVHPQSPQIAPPPNPIAGQVFFQDDALGRNDTLHIEMRNIAPSPQGQSYYAWLESSDNKTISLGQLAIQNGSGTLFYNGNSQHTNLLSITRGLSITLEDSGSVPNAPTGQQVYAGSFNPATLPYIQHILYQLPGFPYKGGIAAGLFETIKSMNDKAGSIVDDLQGSHDYGLVWRQAIRIIQTIDGTDYARSSGDLPAGDPSLLQVPVGIISSPALPGYIDTLATEVGKIQQGMGNDATMRSHVQNINNAIADLRDWIQAMRTYCIQILKTPTLKGFGAPSVLSAGLELKKAAADSYTGRTIPPNEGPLPILGSAGMYQAYVECQYLAIITMQKV